jgi:putative DNA primase/helicase
MHAMQPESRVVQLPVSSTPSDPSASAALLPPPSDGASAQPGGKGTKEKAERRIDWGVVNSLAQDFALIRGTDTAWDGQTLRIVKVSTMRLTFGGDPVKFWLAHPDRRTILPEQLVFEPGHDVVDPVVNMWQGLEVQAQACEPAAVAPMLRLLRHLCALSADDADEVDEIVHWVLCWIALPLQKPGTKMQTALVFHGPQGTGKNLFFDVWRDLYGRYGITVSQTELEDKFNDWLSCKLAIVGDEVVSRQEMYHHKNKLKLVVTQETKFPIRAIQQSVRWESNHANVVFLSNESQPLALEERDRRYMVVYTPTADDTGLYGEVAQFLADGGAAKWLHYLLAYDVGDFGRHTKPRPTRARQDLIELGWKPHERFTHDWLGGFLPLPVRICSNEQLYRAFRRWADQTGEKWPPAQAVFSKGVERWVCERIERDATGQRSEARLAYKVVNVADVGGGRKSMRCWLPAGLAQPEGVTLGDWAREGIDAFETSLRAFCRQASAVGADE